MKLDDLDYEYLISKYRHLGYRGQKLEKRLKVIDSNISLKMLSLTIPYID